MLRFSTRLPKTYCATETMYLWTWSRETHTRLRRCCWVLLLCVLAVDTQVTYEDRHDYCQLETFNATCGEGEIIVMEAALYGRMRAGRCITRSYGNLGCSANVLPALDRRCSGKRSCSLPIPDPLLHKNHPCPKDFTSYLEADYQCVKVSSSSFESCNDTPARVEAGEGYIAGGLLPGSPASSGRGPGTAAASSSVGCSWVIAAQSGQKINLTMINFDYKGGVAGHRHSYRRRGHAGVACTDVAMVTDGDTKQNIRLCEDQPRETQAYLSTSDSIELQIYNRALPGKTPSEKGLFLLQYKAVGCANIDIPSGMWMRREGDNLLVRCNQTEEIWYLTCENEAWKGRIGNCSAVRKWIANEPLTGEDQVPYGILITVAIGVALGVFLGALLLIVVFIIRKHRITQSRDQRSAYQIRECPGRKPTDPDIKGYTPVLDERGHFPISAESFTLSTSFASDRTLENSPDLTTVETPLTAKECIIPLPPPPGTTTTFCLHPEKHIYESTLRAKPCSIRC